MWWVCKQACTRASYGAQASLRLLDLYSFRIYCRIRISTNSPQVSFT
jgi:hypothetical protein